MTTPPNPKMPKFPKFPKLDPEKAELLLWVSLLIQVLLVCGGSAGIALSVIWIVLEIVWYRETQSRHLPQPARIAVGVGGLYLLILLLTLLLDG